MKKRSAFLGLLVFVFTQVFTQAPTTATVVTDTLSYFYNKQYFKNPYSNGLEFPFYKSAAATVTNVTHMGSVFLNTDTALIISGLEGRMAYQNNSTALAIPVRLYLYNVDANLKPTTIIDSVSKLIGSAQDHAFSNSGYQVGGTFTSVAGPVTHKVPGNFAVLMRNLSTLSGDTVRLYRTNGRVPGSPDYNNNTAIGEGFGVVRDNGIFHSTKNYSGNINFGTGTDYEFCVAPIVTFSLYADQIAPPKVNSDPADSVYCWEPLTFTNTSTPHWTNRFFNLNEFYRHFAPYVNTPGGGFSPDSAISWYFDDEGIPPFRPNIILKKDSIRATKYYDTSGCFTSCSMRARYRKMTAGGSSVNYRANIEFSLCVAHTGGCEYVGLNENDGLNNVRVFPNPGSDGKFRISGLKELNTVEVYDILGKLLYSVICQSPELLIDLSMEPEGTYIVKLNNSEKGFRMAKLLHLKE